MSKNIHAKGRESKIFSLTETREGLQTFLPLYKEINKEGGQGGLTN